MDFNWRSPYVTRILILAISIWGCYYFAITINALIPAAIMVFITLYQIKILVDHLEKSQEDINTFLDTIRFDEQSYTFKTDSTDPLALRLHNVLNEVLLRFRNSRRERDSEFLFFRNIVMHVGIGLIAFKENGKIELFNSTARKLLKIKKTHNIHDLTGPIGESLIALFTRLKTGGQELVRLQIQDDIVQLSIYAIELTLRGEHVKLISLQNIQNELEEKEMEAWQNLVRVLTHEIMNSVTPISSLAGTLEEEIRQHLTEEQGVVSLEAHEVDDIHLSLQTISKRSEGLIHFVKEFRSLTNIPKPRPVTFQVGTLLEEITLLHRREITEQKILLETSVYPEDLTLLADKGMIEQVLINLLKNAIQSFDEQTVRTIAIRAFVSDKSRPVITIKDNGPGIDPEALEKIFIPFFTTKKSGSGIGLSLSRQIMRQHKGTLNVKSEVGVGTEFFLRF